MIEAALDADTAASWQRKLLAAGVQAHRVNSICEAFELAERLGLEPSIVVTDPATGRQSRQLTNPVRLSAAASSYRRVPPAIGEHQGSTFAVRSPRPSAKGT